VPVNHFSLRGLFTLLTIAAIGCAVVAGLRPRIEGISGMRNSAIAALILCIPLLLAAFVWDRLKDATRLTILPFAGAVAVSLLGALAGAWSDFGAYVVSQLRPDLPPQDFAGLFGSVAGGLIGAVTGAVIGQLLLIACRRRP
jgi:hypothetical protein